MEFLGTHRGSGLYKVINNSDKQSENNILRKVKSEGVYPGQENHKIEFFAEETTYESIGIPEGKAKLESGDRLVLMGHNKDCEKMMELN